MRVYKIPLKYRPGEFAFHEMDTDEGNCLTLDYDNEHQLLTYNVPLYGGEARLYTVPRELMPEALTAVYDNSGDFPIENRLALESEALGVMLMCADGLLRNRLFEKAVETFAERVKSKVLKKSKTTEDFQFIVEEYD
jgi:hypothetical protein